MKKQIDKKVRKVICQAGELLKHSFRAQVEINEKSPKDFVTSTDIEIDNFLKERLSKIIPGSIIYSEEDENNNFETANWVIDPVDGTANFIFGIPHFSISITYIEDGVPKNAWILNPMTNELFYLNEYDQSFCNNEQIKVSSRNQVKEIYGIFGFSANYSNITRYHIEWKDLFENSKKAIGALSPSLSICAVARGKSDFFIDFGCSIEGKIGAALILEKAGGKIFNYDRTSYNCSNIGIIATNGIIV